MQRSRRQTTRLGLEPLERREMLSATDPSVLFVRGADRSGGFLEAGNDFQRTEQLADIDNTATNGGNHGWNELKLTLEGAGFAVSQITETAETASGPTDGVHIDFEALDLTQHEVVVFGSNNAVYDTAAIDAVEAYIRGGGAALFISDANFGGDWADASDSDQQFLDRFGLIMHQDQGTYSLFRSQGDFAVPDHPILTNVDRFDGEGVTPIELGTPTAGVEQTLLVGAKGNTRLNEPPFGSSNQGPSRPSNPAIDAALMVATADEGKIAGHYDRNTFFNLNGAGTNINRFDNRQYALNLFGWLAGAFDPLPGDYDGSGQVDDADYTLWRNSFGAMGPNLAADGNANGVVDASDYTVWRDNLGASGPDLDLSVSSFAAATMATVSTATSTPIEPTPIEPTPIEIAAIDEAVAERVASEPTRGASGGSRGRRLLLLAAARQATTSAEEGLPAADPQENTDERDARRVGVRASLFSARAAR